MFKLLAAPEIAEPTMKKDNAIMSMILRPKMLAIPPNVGMNAVDDIKYALPTQTNWAPRRS
jgi:hypothetical protein